MIKVILWIIAINVLIMLLSGIFFRNNDVDGYGSHPIPKDERKWDWENCILFHILLCAIFRIPVRPISDFIKKLNNKGRK